MASAKINNLHIAYTDTGIGRPVVLIHGYPFNRSLWNEQIEALSSTCRVIAPDLRGFGETDAAATASMNEMAQDVAQLMDRLEIPQAAIGGVVGVNPTGLATEAFAGTFSTRYVVSTWQLPQSRRSPGKRTSW